VPGDNGFWFDNDKSVFPAMPKSVEQNPKYSILDSQPRARMVSLEDVQLLTKSKDLEAQVVSGTEEGTKAGDGTNPKGNMNPD
jgi:hypothetical protein